MDQEIFIPVYHQDHLKHPYFVRHVKCGSKLAVLSPQLQTEEIYQALQNHKCHVKN